MDSTMKPLSVTDSTPNSPTLSLADDIGLDELDGGGSDFSWSSASPETHNPHSPEEVPSQVPQNASPDDVNIGGVEGATTQAEGLKDPTRRHPTYFWDTILFLVEGVELQLPRYKFIEESERFMEVVAPGTSLKSGAPILLDGILLSDFDAFLKAFLPRSSAMYDDKPHLSKDEWISVLKLSTRWFFNDLRKLALAQLSVILMDGIERICLAKEYRVSSWLQDGYAQIINRLIGSPSPTSQHVDLLSTEEGMKIGMEVALSLSGIAISLLRWPARPPMRGTMETLIRTAFENEIEVILLEEEHFLTQKDVEEAQRRRREEEEDLRRLAAEGEEELRRLAEEQAALERELKELERKREADEREKLEREKKRVSEREEEELRKLAEEEAKLERDLKDLEQKREAEEREKLERERKRAEEEAKAAAKAANDKAKAKSDEEERQRRIEAEELKKLAEEEAKLERELKELERRREANERVAEHEAWKQREAEAKKRVPSLGERLGRTVKSAHHNSTTSQGASGWGSLF